MNLLGMGPMELLLIVVLALIVFGPARLPEIMGQVGKAIGDFRRATSDLSDEFNRTIQAELQETRAMVDEAKSTLTDARESLTEVHTSVTSAVSLTPAPVRTAAPPEALPASNGVSAESHTDALTNGSVPAAVTPPLAETARWSWETSAPAAPSTSDEVGTSEPAEATPAADVSEPSSASTSSAVDPTADASDVKPAASASSAEDAQHSTVTPESSEVKKASPPPSAGQERAARDELLPPY
jgi:sec-independent protein translocase protein TatB